MHRKRDISENRPLSEGIRFDAFQVYDKNDKPSVNEKDSGLIFIVG